MSTSSHDRWLLPRRQTEYPLRDLLPEETLHARREATFLALVAFALLPVAVLVLVGTSEVIDLSTVLQQIAPSFESPIALLLPLGAAAFALSLVAVALACELFGRRRASALVWATTIAALSLAGIVEVLDITGGGAAFSLALALAAASVVAHVVHLVVLDGLRRSMRGRARFFRIVVATFVACALGFGAFVGAVWLEATSDLVLFAPAAKIDAQALAAGAAVWTFALALVLAIPAALAARGLAVALRVGRDLLEGGDDADDVYDAEPAFVPAPARPVRHARGSSQIEPVALASRPPPVSAFDRTEPAPPAAERVARVMTAVTPPELAQGSVSRSLPAAEIVDEEVVPLGPETRRHRAQRVSLQPFSSAEMAFFQEGDALE